MDALAVLASLGGVARRKHLLACGLTDRDLMMAVARDGVTRPHRGCYSLPDASWTALRARMMSSQLTCLSALAALDLPMLERYSGLHLAIPEHRGFVEGDRRLRDGMRFHRVRGDQSFALVAPVATVLDHLGACAEPLTQLAAVDAALNKGMVEQGDIATFTATDLRRLRWLEDHADPRAQSPLETTARLELRTAGLHAEPQKYLDGVGHVDLFVEDRIAVECDGRDYHADPDAFAEDRRRDRACEMLNIPVLRYTGREVLASRGRIAKDVERLLATLR